MPLISRQVIEVRFQRGLYLPECDLWLDPWDAKPRAFVSHGHADHFARHEKAICSETTAAVIRARFGIAESRLDPLPFQVPRVEDGFRIRMLPAGHVLGSAMLHITRVRDNATLLYTGDFKTRRSRIAEPVMFVAADTLILETTYGLPNFVFPPQMDVEAAVMRFCNDAIADGETPVLCGYSFGKAQEALALLAEHGIPAVLHPTVAEMTRVCRELGANLPESATLEEGTTVPPGHVVIAPPNGLRSHVVRRLKNTRTAMLSGWALQTGSNYRYRVDEVLPMSDHADHPGLLECINRVRPRRVLTVHGYAREFAAELRGKGKDAWCAAGGDQLELAPIVANQASGGGRSHAAIAPRHIRPICEMADFSDICRLVGETSSRLAKIEYIANYLKGIGTLTDLRLAAFWLSGEALPREAGRRPLHVGVAALRRALTAIPGCREERYREISATQNDAARTARLLLQELALKPEPLRYAELDQFFLDLAAAPGSIARIQLLSDRLHRLHPVEGETLVKLLTGDLRIGLREGLVEEAVAAAFNADISSIRQAHMLTGDIGEAAALAHCGRLDEAALRPLVPIKAMLASPLERIEGSDEHTTDIRFAPLPFPTPLWLEPKFDGIRAQLHKAGGRAALFSRDLRPLDAEFPELIRAALRIPGDFILDGELIAHADGRKLGFADLQKRLGRKAADGDLFLIDSDSTATIPLRFIAFDALWMDGSDLTPCPLSDRRAALESIALDAPFEIIPCHRPDDPSAVDAHFKQAIRDGHEGLIAKDPASTYTPGRRGRAWLKLKGVMPTLDCVVTIAEQGHGKRSDVLSDYTFAVRDEATGTLRVIGKAYSGLTDLEIEDLTEHFKKHTLRKERRKHHVEPNLVLEIAFDAIRRSTRHDSGLALRFPRIKTIRRDKTLDDIDTLQTATALL
ncbi:MAG: ATP-dependent DNA ligase [Luteolibacter sp.]